MVYAIFSNGFSDVRYNSKTKIKNKNGMPRNKILGVHVFERTKTDVE